MIYQIVGILLLAIIIIDLAMRIYFGRKALQLLEKMPPFHVESSPPQKDASPFTVELPEGLTLRGSIYHPQIMPPQGIVLYCPETISSHWSAPKYCQALIDSGFVVVSFDFRNQGESDSLPGYESLHWVTEYEISDLQAVVNWIREQPALEGLPMGLMGVSRGASSALVALARSPEIQFACCDSAYTNDLLISHYIERWAPLIVPRFIMRCSPSMWHIRKTLDVAIWVRGFKRHCRYINSPNPFEKMIGKRVLLISGGGDSYVPTRIARKIQKLLGAQCQELWIVPKASHNGARTKEPAAYDSKLVQFFNQMVPAPAETTARKPLATRSAEKVALPAK